jgi:putative endonuclease
MDMPYAYMVKCFDGTFYVGSTWSLERRIWQHNHGKAEGGASYTAARRPVVLVYFEEYELMIDAYGREKQLQNWGRKKRVALMEGRIADLVKRMPPDGPDGSVDPAT